MPGYPGSGLATEIYENKQAFFWQGETVAAGTASVAFQLRRTRGLYYPFGFSVELSFAGAPGAFEADIQTADSDTPSSYIYLGKIIAASSLFAARYENTTAWCKYVRLQMVSLTNVVGVTAMLTR
jgi:hypothetical protein